MQAVGRLGSYISKSVYNVSGPFHPFGGAVDIIVVLQPDSSFKSSPWYVRFGKFQGVLKSKEKLVKISVNGVEADFHMILDRKGEAYFERVVDTEEDGSPCSGPSTSGEDTDVQYGDRKSKSCNGATSKLDSNVNGSGVPRTSSRRSQIFGLVFGNRSKGNVGTQEELGSDVGRTDSLERAEIAADLLDLNWSTPRGKRDAASRFFAEDVPKDVGENLSVDGVVPNSSCQKVDSNVGGNNTEYIVGTETLIERVRGDDTTLSNSELTLTDNLSHAKEGVFSEELIELANGSETELRMDELNLVPEEDMVIGQGNSNIQECLENGDHETFLQVEKTRITLCSSSESIVTESYLETIKLPESGDSGKELESNGETLLFGELDDVDCTETAHADGVSSLGKCYSEFSADQSSVNGHEDNHSKIRGLRNVCSVANMNTGDVVQTKELTRAARSLPSMSPISNCLDASLKSEEDYESNDHQPPCVQSRPEDIKIVTECKDGAHNPSSASPPRPNEGSRRSWPFSFSRSRSIKSSPPGPVLMAGSENSNEATSTGDSTIDLGEDKSTTKANMNNRKIITAVAPSSEELASLNLKEGQNIVIFTFSTAMLGQQQVDARIFLWRWDSRIVISDVDGTITRSDLLGQVMPLVGMDWSQTGVAHFFSAIKENGYQFIFLSARSISQAFITRQFLFKIKQDGKALPDGPVVISPDGLFPSLFREVVRRAPHEFKIACLEDIKALFPADTNPFYAGFGNRDTDEFSYLKVGIPRSKIFIINPKGEIVVNRRIDTKSYVSLHSLVHGMFPTITSSSEQEDFNTWNYWKFPPPTIDD